MPENAFEVALHLRGSDSRLQPAHYLQPPGSGLGQSRRAREGVQLRIESERKRNVGRIAQWLLHAGEFR